ARVERAPLRRPATRPPAAPAFSARQAVKVRRYGEGQVVCADSGSITVEFADGSRRSFVPGSVEALPHAARGPIAPKAGTEGERP
ncbi:MAG: hypothetical protein J7549_05735, partial [Variovorax sp.]|nr:hypothetical protein [Variovorax sp.]